MAGTPVWLCSISRRSPLSDKPLATGLWTQERRDESAALLRRVLGPAGNPARERLFRMNITMCLHRALTAEEVAALPAYFHTDTATDLAGGPVEILWESERGLPSTKPCEHPERRSFGYNDPLLWLPLDCGQCPPCQARRALDEAQDAKTAAARAMLRVERCGSGQAQLAAQAAPHDEGEGG